MKTICLTGGGTAGHIMPHIALLPELKEHFNNIYYIGSTDGLEKNILAGYKEVHFLEVTTTKLIRRFTLKNLLIPFKLFKGIREAKAHLKKIMPNVIFSKGGFVSVPVVIAAKKLHIPVISHESDLTLGLANKIIYHYSKAMCVSFERTVLQIKKRGVFTGSPIRAEIFLGDKDKIFSAFKLDKNKPTILFVGGSLGAQVINAQVFNCAKELTQNYNVLHITGKNNKNNALFSIKNYIQVEFTNNIEDFYASADCVISRAGSNVIFELLALKKPMILIPLSKKASRGDQLLNAEYFRQRGYARVLPEENLTSASLKQKIYQTLKTKDSLVINMSAQAFQTGNKNIVEQLIKYSL
ncbi:MAG: undecaprenyldiphospho-muramoylpentapeptide beta-N-acetylglucosaminyltransferase [Clostridia bacterium]|nr:undecaprenyldiphospho-muramoylpentapeptide beta-N-acetylglucosaminyltransferase [Clostridia bacterium]